MASEMEERMKKIREERLLRENKLREAALEKDKLRQEALLGIDKARSDHLDRMLSLQSTKEYVTGDSRQGGLFDEQDKIRKNKEIRKEVREIEVNIGGETPGQMSR